MQIFSKELLLVSDNLPKYFSFTVDTTKVATRQPDNVYIIPFVPAKSTSGDGYSAFWNYLGMGNVNVDWGDNTTSVLTENFAQSDCTHTYATGGTYTITITNKKNYMPIWSYDIAGKGNEKLISILTPYLTMVVSQVTGQNATPMKGYLTYIQEGSTLTRVCGGDLNLCTNLTSIPSTLLARNKQLELLGGLLSGCTSIHTIPQGLLDPLTNLSGSLMNFQDSGVTSIPENLYAKNLKLEVTQDFSGTNISAIPQKLFYNNINLKVVRGFSYTPLLKTLPTELFKNNIHIGEQLTGTLWADVSGADLGFSYAFSSSGLETLPDDLFTYCPNCYSFTETFKDCNNLTLNPNIFGTDLNRFYKSGVEVYFNNMFYRDSFTGTTQGTAPALWNFNYLNVDKTNCFGGDGNNFESIYNYEYIPRAWGSNISYGNSITTTAANESYVYPLTTGTYTGVTFKNLKIAWGDNTSTTLTNTITTENLTHTYATAGTYKLTLTEDNNCMPLVTTDTQSTALTGSLLKCYDTSGILVSIFKNLYQANTKLTTMPNNLFAANKQIFTFSDTFQGCTALTTIPTDLFRYNVNATDFGNTFQGCTALTTIPTDLFRYNTAVTSFRGFYSTFRYCSSLTTIPTDLFKYNVNVTDFRYTFDGCNKLTLNPNIFGSNFEGITSQTSSINFTSMFNRSSFTGTTQGTAPALWSVTFKATPTSTSCFAGGGNSATSLSNYADIPAAWKA